MNKTPLLLLIAAAWLAQLPGQPTATPAYNWAKTGPLQVARQGACAAALQDGRILVAGGLDSSTALRSVEIYHQDGSFTRARDMLRARAGHTCTSLLDGRILVAGGQGDGPAVEAETYDPATDSWTPAKSGAERWNHTATLLSDGRVLLAGGETADGPTALLEWFNPASNRIRKLPASLSAARTLHAAAALPDGSVLVAGGWNSQNLLDSAETVKLNGSVQKSAALSIARAGHTATALDNGCVLIAGGVGPDGDLKSASQYCTDTGTFHAAGDMSKPRYGHLALLLPNNGKVLIVGGFSQGEAIAASELYDPIANTFGPAGALTLARLGIAAAVDPVNEAVLAVGGYTSDGPVAACGILRGPSVTFDKPRYLDGDPVTLTGLTWTPGETVKLTVTTQPFSKSGLLLPITTQDFQTVASPLGRIQVTPFTASTSTVGATFRVTATGATSGLTASSAASEVSRTNVTMNVFPFPALTRQPVTIQAIVQPVTTLDALDGTVNFQLGSSPLGSVTSTNQVTTIGQTGQITDGTSNTILIGEALPLGSSGFTRTVTFPDGSVHFLDQGGAFQLVTRDIPAGSAVLSGTTPGSVTVAYSAFTSLYGPGSVASTVSVQKRTVNVSIATPAASGQPKVGDPISLSGIVAPIQQPFADMVPTGKLHLTVAPGTILDSPLSSSGGFNSSAITSFTVKLPAGIHSFSAQYDGDSVYQPGGVSGVGTVNIAKGTVGFSLVPGKLAYTVGKRSLSWEGFSIQKWLAPLRRDRSRDRPAPYNLGMPPWAPILRTAD